MSAPKKPVESKPKQSSGFMSAAVLHSASSSKVSTQPNADEPDSDDQPLIQKSKSQSKQPATQESDSDDQPLIQKSKSHSNQPATQESDSDDRPLVHKGAKGKKPLDQASASGKPPPAKKVKRILTAAESVEQSTPEKKEMHLSISTSLELVSDPRIVNAKMFKKWLASIPSITCGPVDHTDPPIDVPYITDAPIFENRDYQIIENGIQEEYVERRRDGTPKTFRGDTGIPMKNREQVDIYTVTVKDLNAVSPDEIKLFANVAQTNEMFGGLLSKDVCSTEADARLCGERACAILNRITMPLDTYSENSSAELRRFVNIHALYGMNAEFDHGSLPEVWLPPQGYYHDLTQPLGIWDAHLDGYVCVHALGCVRIGSGLGMNVGTDTLGVYIRPDAVNVERMNEDGIRAPQWFYYQGIYVGKKAAEYTKKQLKNAVRLLNYVQYMMFGRIGSTLDLQNLRDRLVEPYVTRAPRQKGGHYGWYGGKKIFKIQYRSDTVSSIVPTASALASVDGTLPYIYFKSTSKVCIAYAITQMYHMSKLRKGILNIWQAGIVAAVESAIRTISRDQIVAEYCGCVTSKASGETYHLCISCLKPVICNTMREADDGRLVCGPCGRKGLTEDHHLSQLSRKVRVMARGAVRHECTGQKKPFDKDLFQSIVNKARSFLGNKEQRMFLDGYGPWRTTFASMWTKQESAMLGFKASSPSVRSQAHPLQPSLEAVFPLVVEDGVIRLHCPTNVILTALHLNYLHGTSNTSVIPLVKQAIQLSARELNGENVDEMWDVIYLGFDNAYMIRSRYPYTVKARLSMKVPDEDTLNRMKDEWVSGVWSGEPPAMPMFSTTQHLRDTWRHRRSEAYKNIVADVPHADFKKWDFRRKAELNNLIDEIEDAELPDGAAPVPRSEDGAPWLFNIKHRPDDYSYDYLFAELVRKYWTLDEWCDRDHETIGESPDTLLVVFVVLWCRTGGKDPLCKFLMTCFLGHPLAWSYGRADHVQPGSVMRTGCTTAHPTSYAQHYDESRRTIVVEPWIINRMKSNFPPGTFKTILNDLSDLVKAECEWYGPVSGHYTEVPFPKTVKKYGKFMAGSAKPSARMMVNEEDDDLDDWTDDYESEGSDVSDFDQEDDE